MKYLMFFIGVFTLLWTQPVSSQSLNLTYSIENDWKYCQIHKEECIRIGNYVEKPIFPKFDLQPSISNKQWAVFYTFQILDIYTTYRALAYDCVFETNPLMGERPSVIRMVATKTIIMTPAFKYDLGQGNLTEKDMNQMNFLMSLVVGNNYSIYQDAKRNCFKTH